mgnify:CR=1 FL=1
MTQEELKAALGSELEGFKKTLPSMQDIQSVQNALKDFQSDIEKKFDGIVTNEQFAELKNAAEIQGNLLAEIQRKGQNTEKTFAEQYKENASAIAKAISEGKPYSFGTTRKAVTAASITNNTNAYRIEGVGQSQRGIPFVADLLPRVVLGSNTGGTVRWIEQSAITNNAGAVAEGNKTTESVATWEEKSLAGKRIKDHIKVSIDQIKDEAYMIGEVTQLVNNNMRIAEDNALINGDGLNNNIKGLLSYATEFATADISIKAANFVDLVGKCKTQIAVNTKGGAMPTNFIANPTDVDVVRYLKNEFDMPIYPNWQLGGAVSFGGMTLAENALMTANKLIVGDLSKATLYVFDELVVELIQVDDDALKGLVTVNAYIRENLVVKSVYANAIVKVSDISAALTAITAGA